MGGHNDEIFYILTMNKTIFFYRNSIQAIKLILKNLCVGKIIKKKTEFQTQIYMMLLINAL